MLNNGTSSDKIIIDDIVFVIFNWFSYAVTCQLFNIAGIITNVINSVCFVKQGFTDSINICLLGLSVSDLGSLITMIWTCISITPAFSSADLPFESLDVVYLVSAMPHFSFTRVSSCITAMITFERCLSIALPFQIKRIVTPKRTTIAITCIFTFFLLSAAPVYVVNRLEFAFSALRNKTIVRIVFREDREQVEKMSFAINNFFLPLGAFLTIVICTIILSSQLHSKTEWRKTKMKDTQTERISSRNLKVAKMVVVISTLYIACYGPFSIILLALAFEPALALNGKYEHITILMGGFAYIMESINSSMNIFIYYRNSSKYRETILALFKGLKHQD